MGFGDDCACGLVASYVYKYVICHDICTRKQSLCRVLVIYGPGERYILLLGSLQLHDLLFFVAHAMADTRYLIAMLDVDFRSHSSPQNCRQSRITNSVVGCLILVGAGPDHVRGNFGTNKTVEASGMCSIITR